MECWAPLIRSGSLGGVHNLLVTSAQHTKQQADGELSLVNIVFIAICEESGKAWLEDHDAVVKSTAGPGMRATARARAVDTRTSGVELPPLHHAM